MRSLEVKTKKQLIKEIEKLRDQIKNTDIKGNEENIVGHLSSGRDITERLSAEQEQAVKRAEDALRQYDRIISATNDHMSFLDRNYIYQTVNEAYLQAHQKAWDEIVGHSVADLLGVDIFERLVKENLNRCLAGEEIHYQSWFDFPGLGQRYMDVAYYPYFETDGEVSGVVVSSHDITERKQAEEEIQIERDNLRNILESMDDGVYIVNQKYDIQYVNPVLKKEFGEVKGRKCYEYFHDRKDVCPCCQNKEVWKGKTVRWEWYSFKNQRTYDLIDTPLKNPDGSICKLEIFRDITERRQTEEKLRESEERLDLALKGTGVGTWDWGIQTDEIIYNERWAEIIGYTLEELSPINTDILKKFTHPDDLKKSNALIKKHFSGESDHYECEVRMKHKNGNWIWILDRGKVFEWNKDGKPIRMVGTHSNITAQKKIEEERRRVIKVLEEKIDKKDLPEGFISMCAGCNKIRDEQGIWYPVTNYLSKHTNLVFSHGMCPDCIKEYYGEDVLKKINDDENK